MIGLREDKDPENCFHIKHSNFTRLDFLSVCPCTFSHMLFFSINFFILFFTFCLLTQIHS